MNKYLKEFLHRGLMFGGFGPIVAGIIFLILSYTVKDFSLGGTEMFMAIISTYLIAFLQAGASIFNQIEHWPLAKSLGCHFLTVYLAYTLCYLVNTWIPFVPMVIVIFTAIFLAVYLTIWFTVYFIVKAASKKMNRCINNTL